MPIRWHCGFLLAESLQRALLVSALSAKQSPNARAYMRASAVFRFLPSPLHHQEIIH